MPSGETAREWLPGGKAGGARAFLEQQSLRRTKEVRGARLALSGGCRERSPGESPDGVRRPGPPVTGNDCQSALVTRPMPLRTLSASSTSITPKAIA